MGPPAWLEPLQALADNRLDARDRTGFIGLIGDHPSSYSLSPRIWTPALDEFRIDATYLPLDVQTHRLPKVVKLLRRTEPWLGANVTVPHKETIVPLLDEVDVTGTIGAANTIFRTSDGRLVGTNTDGVGLVTALLDPCGGLPVVKRLEGATVLLIGGGGAARAAALALAPLLGPGELLVTNRHEDRARLLARAVAMHGCRVTAVSEEALERHLPTVSLVINASLRGQAGIRKNPRGKRPRGWTCLEPYSALAPASPAYVPSMPEERFLAVWSAQSTEDIVANHVRSRARMRLLPSEAAVFDMVYSPAETTTLRHAREAGLRTANGRSMMIAQAAASFVDHICRSALVARGVDLGSARATVTRVMAQAWEG